jgi:HemY protein
MKLLFTILITLILAVSIALFAMDNPGYVLIAAGDWTAESTLAFSVVVILLSFTVLYYALRFVSGVRHVRGGLREWQHRRHERKAMKFLTRGLIDSAEGHWAASEKHVLKHVEDSHAPLLNYLAAARAAQAQGEDQRRDYYLKKAHESYEGADIAVGLTQAELQLQQQQLEQALATLRHLHQLAPKHAQVLKVLATVYQRLGDWERLLELVPELHKRKVFSQEEIDQLSHQAYLSLINKVVASKALINKQVNEQVNKEPVKPNAANIEALTSLWLRIPRHLQEDEEILLTYIHRLIQCGGDKQVEPIMRHALKKHRNQRLIHLYGLIEGDNVSKQLSLAEVLLIGHENDPVVLLTAGRLSLRNKLWGKARNYLEASISAGPSAEAYNELGNLLEHLGEQKLAASCFRKGLRLAPDCEQPVPITMEKGISGTIEHGKHESGQEDLSGSESEAVNVPAELQSK